MVEWANFLQKLIFQDAHCLTHSIFKYPHTLQLNSPPSLDAWLCEDDSEVKKLSRQITKLEQRSEDADAPASFQAFKGHKILGAFMVG